VEFVLSITTLANSRMGSELIEEIREVVIEWGSGSAEIEFNEVLRAILQGTH
jgi:hypothetical protein